MNDFLVIGGGIAGASAAYFLADHGSVVLIDMEDMLGYHATGRSAALFSEYYGNRCVRALTAASRSFFDAPPDGFGEHPLLSPRGVVALGPSGEEARFEAALADGRETASGIEEIGIEEVQRFCPIVREGWYSRAMYKPGAMDIDVHALHHGFLRGLKAKGGILVAGAPVRSLMQRGGIWHAVSDGGEFSAPAVVNAAGAWADEVAGLAGVRRLNLVPKRRTAMIVEPPAGLAVGAWPMVADVTERFYFKPEAGNILVSPADATPVPPCDAQPDEFDVATAAARFEEVTTLAVRRICHRWAGLRTFARDDTPVVGEASDASGFFWLAGLGGYGIQIAPALGRIVAASATSTDWPAEIEHRGLTPAMLSPARLF